VPHPVLLVIGGALLATLPGLPRVDLDPAVLFLVFVPPLLYRASLTTSLREFRAAFWPIVRLGVLLVLVTIIAVAYHRAGVRLSKTASVETIRSAIERVVREPEFRGAAQQLGQHIREEADAEAAITELEHLAQQRHLMQ
jgi:hypothetical protein